MNINKANAIIARTESQISNIRIKSQHYKNIACAELIVGGARPYNTETLTQNMRFLCDKKAESKLGAGSQGYVQGVYTPGKFLYMFEDKHGPHFLSNMAKIKYVLRELNLLKRVQQASFKDSKRLYF